jgi:hypothetical protein
MMGPAYEMTRRIGPQLWKRYLHLMLDGLRATDRPALEVPAPPLDAVEAIITVGKSIPDAGSHGRNK